MIVHTALGVYDDSIVKVPARVFTAKAEKPRISAKHSAKSFAQLCAEIGDTTLVRHHKAIIAATDCKQCATRRAEVALQSWLTKQSQLI